MPNATHTTLWETPTTSYLIHCVWDAPMTQTIPVTLHDTSPHSVRARYSVELRGLRERARSNTFIPGDEVRRLFRQCYTVAVREGTLVLIPNEMVYIDSIVQTNPGVTFGSYIAALEIKQSPSNSESPREASSTTLCTTPPEIV